MSTSETMKRFPLTLRELSVCAARRYKHLVEKGLGMSLPVDWLHFSDDAYYCSWRKFVKFLEKIPDVGPVLQVQVKLHDMCQTLNKGK